jgi:hypothetical protein
MIGSFRTLNNAWYGRGPLTLEDGRQFSFPSAFGWVEASPENFLPAFTAPGVPRVTPATTLASSSDTEKVGLLTKPDYVGGEVGARIAHGGMVGEAVPAQGHRVHAERLRKAGQDELPRVPGVPGAVKEHYYRSFRIALDHVLKRDAGLHLDEGGGEARLRPS